MRCNWRLSAVIRVVAVLRHASTSSRASLMMTSKSLASSGALVSLTRAL